MLKLGTIVQLSDEMDELYKTMYKNEWGIITLASNSNTDYYYVIKPFIFTSSTKNKRFLLDMEQFFWTEQDIAKTEEGIFSNYPIDMNINFLSKKDMAWAVEHSTIMDEKTKERYFKEIKKIRKCADCGKEIYSDFAHKTTKGTYVCSNCRNNYYYCEHCGILMPRNRYDEEPSYVIGAQGGLFCSIECQEAAQPFNFEEEIRYDAKVPPKFKGSTNKKDLYLGIEVEVDSDYDRDEDYEMIDDCIYNLSKITKDIYCKHDGSLSCGFEFVTHPCTLEYHKKVLEYDDLIRKCKDYGFYGDYDTAGLHVHVNKSFFGRGETLRLNALKLELIMEKFKFNIKRFARRDAEKIDRWARLRNYYPEYTCKNTNKAALKRLSEILWNDANRYTAINLTNSSTIEFRIFGGTTSKKLIFATLEFVDFLCRFVKDIDIKEIKDLEWFDITSAIEEKDVEYFNLIEVLVRMNLIERQVA